MGLAAHRSQADTYDPAIYDAEALRRAEKKGSKLAKVVCETRAEYQVEPTPLVEVLPAIVPGDLNPAELERRLAPKEAEIMARLSGAEPLDEVARIYHVAPGQLAKWLNRDEDRSREYALSREAAAHLCASRVLVVAMDDGRLADDRRIRVDALKWLASRWNPRVYGDKLDITTNDKPVSDVAQVEARLANLIQQVQVAAKKA